MDLSNVVSKPLYGPHPEIKLTERRYVKVMLQNMYRLSLTLDDLSRMAAIYWVINIVCSK